MGAAFAFLALIALTVVSRLIDHWPNFTPILAVAIFGAARFRNKWAAFFAPLIAMVISDIAIEIAVRAHWFTGWLSKGSGFYSGIWVVYLSVGITWLMGLALRRRSSVASVTAVSLAGAMQFFLVTNFAWWLGYDMYPHTWAGLIDSYVKAVPFFGSLVAGTLFYSAVLFGGFALAQRFAPDYVATQNVDPVGRTN